MCLDDSNCVDLISSNCVTWQGDNIPCLGITTGMMMTQVENLITTKICQTATGIDLSSVTLCGEFIEAMSSRSKTIGNLFQVLLNYGCTLKSLIDALPDSSTDNIVLDYKCITTVLDECDTDGTDTLQHILQLLINNFCDLKAEVDGLGDSILTNIDSTIVDKVTNMLETCQDNRIVSNNLPGSARKLTFKGFVPPFCPLPYFGPLNYFDGSGKGLDNDMMCGWYLCNGNNGTPDLRGRTLVGAVQGMGGGTLSPDVDPSLPKNTGSNYSVGDGGGEVRHLLSASESGSKSHTHTVNDPGHAHKVLGMEHNTGGDGGGSQPRDYPNGGQFYYTDSKTTGITLSAYLGESASSYHENRMPFIAAYYIMMIN